MISKTFFKTPQGQIARVTFTLPDSLWADTICLVGDFDGWNSSAHPLEHRRDGVLGADARSAGRADV